MAWKGKAAGAALGSFVAGPIGGAVGGVLGHLFDEPQTAAISNPQEPQTAAMSYDEQWQLTLMALFVSAAKSNGQIHPKKRTRLNGLAKEIFGAADAREAEASVNRIAYYPASLQEFGEIINGLSEEARLVVVAGIFSLVYADGSFDTQEYQWVDQLIISSGSDPGSWNYVLQFYERPDQAAPRTAWLKLLELSEGASPEQIKLAYHRRCLDYHPDRLGNVAPHIRALAEERLREINAAYEGLCALGTCSGLIVGISRQEFKPASEVTDSEVLCCVACGQMNRVKSAKKLRAARCGNCHALLAIPVELVLQEGAEQQGQPQCAS